MRTFSSLAVVGLLVAAASASTAARAQTGPLEPRMVLVAMPTPVPKPALNVTQRVPLSMEISADGRVTSVEVLESSGDAKFDEKVKKYYSRFRFVPALTDDGTPTPGIFRFAYKYNVDGKADLPHTPTRAPENPNSARNPFTTSACCVPRSPCSSFTKV
jgi:TonB family protein